MTVAQQLYDLLEIDEEIDRHRDTLASIEAGLMDNHLLLQARQAVEESTAAQRGQEAERRDLEINVESCQEKVARVEKKLYGGTVTNPRELQDLQAEMNILVGQQREQEEKLLLVLESLEKAQSTIADLESTLRDVEATWQGEQGRLMEEKERIHGALSMLGERRKSLSSLVDPRHLAFYSNLRSTRHKLAVVKVERGMCQGCRIALPTRIVQTVRTSTSPVQCPSCSRILYVG